VSSVAESGCYDEFGHLRRGMGGSKEGLPKCIYLFASICGDADDTKICGMQTYKFDPD
jgi:hypothetical protein